MRSDIVNPTSTSPEIIAESGNYLTVAVEWFKQNDIPLYGIQVNPTQHTWTSSPKAYGQIMIDDSALGCPLTSPQNETRPFVDWVVVKSMLQCSGVLAVSAT
jgi:hypothetical protein